MFPLRAINYDFVSLRRSDSQCRKVVRLGALGFQVLTLERHVNQRTQNRLVT
jgi:hypothetical protein